ncbi:Uncharacterised protein [Vibrio cholerae]|nr:Uncharacterised protein [Vibrio cholerae]
MHIHKTVAEEEALHIVKMALATINKLRVVLLSFQQACN